MEAPRIPGFFKSKGPKRFNFMPRYYDEQKERIDQRREALKRDLQADSAMSEAEKENFRTLMRKSSKHGTYRQSAKKSNIRLAVILMLLIIAAVIFWNRAESLI